MGEIPQNQETEKKDIDKMETLKEKGIVYFDVGLAPEEKEKIQEVKIENEPEEFKYYGPANDCLIELTNYFDQLGDNSKEIIDSISSLIARMASDMQKDFNKEFCWVNVRVSLPKNAYKIPRWHVDGNYFDLKKKKEEKEAVYKLVFTLTGPPTRFAEKTDPEKFDRLMEEDSESIPVRKELMSTVEEIEPPSNEQAAMYRVGGGKDAKAHSEPEMTEVGKPRIFVQMLVGSESQMHEMKNFREK